ncbi:GTP-binding protein [Nakamurella leprariae]|uniref:GTP-binding protein n=1 Tax=Nakamurella leprariae TaxID=2803911 RepID=A0A938YG90_9ACTN|nr:GTP-binding protein [Nakamurella leprariae]MBM9469324.1 GTP-binding protein [Nakamurella leprariae]
MTDRVSVVVAASMDAVLRDMLSFTAVAGAPRTGVLRQDLDPVAGTLRRLISDAGGVVEDVTLPLEHTCLGCAVREDSLPTLAAMAASGRWDRIMVCLPVSAATPPLARPLADPAVAADLGTELIGVVTVVDAERVPDDLFGQDMLRDRSLHLSDDDGRSVGEALAAQLRHVDLVITAGTHGQGDVVIEHVRGAGTHRAELYSLDATRLFTRRHDGARAEARIDPRLTRPTTARDSDGVWTLDLESPRPMHPERFVEGLERLMAGSTCSRGRFFLPTRPELAGEWEGVGSQLSIGAAGPWQGQRPTTRLVFTGTTDVRAELTRAFSELLMTEVEAARAERWIGQDDGLDPWLGQRRFAA